MAVSPVFRRKGVASRLLEAAEQVAAGVQGEQRMFLHLRFVVSWRRWGWTGQGGGRVGARL